MSLEAYVKCDPRIKSVILFSKSCFNLAAGMSIFAFTQLIVIGLGLLPDHGEIDSFKLWFYFTLEILLSFIVVTVGVAAAFLLKLISLREINSRMKLELDLDHKK